MATIDLCLSGGGFRATYFHLGVIKLLRDARLLTSVERICAVSGGSIMAANLACQWDDYCLENDEVAFYRAAKPLFNLGGMDLRGRLVRRWLIFGWMPLFRRMALLERYYSQFLGSGSLASLPRRPDCHFVATSLSTGRATSFCRDGFQDGSRIHPATDISIAYAVAASSAFPALFPAVEISRDKLRARVDAFPLGTDYLTDGGVFDNLGIAWLRELRASRGDAREALTLVSNASAPFDWTPEPLPTIVHRTARTTDILMARVAKLETRIRGAETEDTIELAINSIVADDGKSKSAAFELQDSPIQNLVAQVRTDLDEFSAVEICSLVRHGYEVALFRLREAGLVPEGFRPLDPCVVRYPAVGWPFNESLIASVPKLRQAIGTAMLSIGIWKDVHNISRKYAAPLGQVSAPPLSRHEDESAQKRLVRDLSKSSLRKLRLWNASDPFCWVVAAAICAIGAFSWFSTKYLAQ